eukprot:m.414223 g.414223  ORF g.414223 m.414223 type:complete len:216 (-) comp29284_c0_seq1:43-690(-)
MYASPSQLGLSRHSKRRKCANSQSPYRSSGACPILAVPKAAHIIVHPFDRRRPVKPQHEWYKDLKREIWRDFIKKWTSVTHCSVLGVVRDGEDGDIVAVLYRQATDVSTEYIVVHLKLYAPGSLPYQVSKPGSRCSSNRTHQLVIMEEETFSCFVTARSFAEEASASPSWATGDAALVALRECFLKKRFYQKKAFFGLGHNQLVYIPGITKGLAW